MKKLLITLLLFFGFYSFVNAESKVWSIPDNYRTNLIDKIQCFSGGVNNTLYVWAKHKYAGSSSLDNSDNFFYIYIVDGQGNLIDSFGKSRSENIRYGNSIFSIAESGESVFISAFSTTANNDYNYYFNIGFSINKNTCGVNLYYNDTSSSGYGKLAFYKDYIIYGIDNESINYKGYIKQNDPTTFLTGGLDLSNAEVIKSNPYLYYDIVGSNYRIYTDKIYIHGFYNNYFRHENVNDTSASARKKTITDTYYDDNGIKTDYSFSYYSGNLDYYKFQMYNNYAGSNYMYLLNINNSYLPLNLDFYDTNQLSISLSGSLDSDGTYYFNYVGSGVYQADILNKLIAYDNDNIYLYTNSGTLNYLYNGIYNGIGIQDLNGTNYLSYAKSDGVYLDSTNTNNDITSVENTGTDNGGTDDGNDGGNSGTGSDEGYFSWIGNPFEGLFDKATNIGDTDDTIGKTKAIGSGYINLGNSIGEIGQEVENHDLDINYDTGGISSEGTQLIDSLTLKKDKVEGSFLYTAYLIMKIFAIVVIIIIIIVIILSLI